MRTLAVVAAMIGCGFVAAAARAENSAPGAAASAAAEPYRLGALVVDSGPAQDADTGQTISTISAEEIAAKGAKSLDQALNTTTGLNLSPGGGGIQRLFLRGLPPRHTPLYLNGIPLNSAADGQFDPSLIPVENIAEVKVIEGNSSVLYGPGTTAGVIDIITKRGGDSVQATAWGEYGSGPSWLGAATLSGPLGSGDFFLSGSHFSTLGYPLTNGSTRLDSDHERNNGFLHFGDSKGDWSFGFTGSYLNGAQGIPPSTIAAGNPFAQPQQFERLNAIYGLNGEVDLAYRPNGPFSVRLAAYVNQLFEKDDRYDNGNFNSMSDPTVQTFHQQINSVVSGTQTLATYDLGRLGTVSGALGLRSEEQVLTGVIRDVPVSGGGGGGGRGRGGGGGGAIFAFRNLGSDDALLTYWTALQYAASPVPRTHLVLGIGENWFVEDGARTMNGAQGMVGLGYDLLDSLRLDGSFSHKVRFPTVQELFDARMGTPTLNPEFANGWEAQLVWRPWAQTSLLLTGFRNSVRNFIQNDMTTQHFTNKDTLIRGFEIAANAQLLPALSARVGYTYLDTQDETTGVQVNFRPKDILYLEADATPLPDWAVHAIVTYVADQVVSSSANPLIQEHLPDYAIVSARLSRAFPAVGLKVYGEVDNLFNASYVFAPGFPAPGRTFLVGAQVAY